MIKEPSFHLESEFVSIVSQIKFQTKKEISVYVDLAMKELTSSVRKSNVSQMLFSPFLKINASVRKVMNKRTIFAKKYHNAQIYLFGTLQLENAYARVQMQFLVKTVVLNVDKIHLQLRDNASVIVSM